MNKFITNLVSRVEVIFCDLDYIHFKSKNFFRLAIVLTFINFLITLIYRDFPLLSSDFFRATFNYVFLDYLFISILICIYKFYKEITQDKILNLVKTSRPDFTWYDFDVKDHPRYSLTFRLKTYFKSFLGLVLIAIILTNIFMPRETDCSDFRKAYIKEYDSQNRALSYQYQCFYYETTPDRFGREIIYLKKDTSIISNFDNIETIKRSEYYTLKVFFILLPIIFLGVRQGIWSRKNIEKSYLK